jgi:hypothetical protein
LPHDLGPKGFYSGRDKSDLEVMTGIFSTDRSIRRGPARYGWKDKVILKSVRESYGYFTYRCLYL